MDILVSGSMAYDRIMDFDGQFSSHILADQLDNINVSFTVNSLTENFGGTAGNIAYSLSLLGEKPRILATIGQDYHRRTSPRDPHRTLSACPNLPRVLQHSHLTPIFSLMLHGVTRVASVAATG